MDFKTLSQEIAGRLRNVPKAWDGKKSILAMKNVGYQHWRQMEWIGFYFQFLCEIMLENMVYMPGPSYGRVGFDGFKSIPWDFKAHVINTGNTVIVNDKSAIQDAIKDYGEVGLILASGQADYNDAYGEFKRWHDQLKGGMSDYEKNRIQRGTTSRKRKIAFYLRRIDFVKITQQTLETSGSFQKNFRNSDGSPRREKVSINLRKIQKAYTIDYDIDS